MKRYFYIISIIIVIYIISFFTSNYTQIPNKNKKISEVKKYIKYIKSISPKDTIFSDFFFLKNTLKNKDIVLLGEQEHNDGATFLAKSRLIKYLHKELDFDVILYETGFYDTYNLWKELKTSEKKSIDNFSKALYEFWWNNIENKELLDYILKNINTKKEIEVAGFDVQFSGIIKNNVRDSVLMEYLQTKNEINANKFPSFFSIKKKYNFYALKWRANKLTENLKDSILIDIHKIVEILGGNSNQNSEDSTYLQFFKNIEVLYTYTWKYKYGSEIRFQIRDSAMAENFIWLKENKYKKKKVIIWAANLHTGYDNNSYTPIPVKFTSMGERIKRKYGKRCYSINFTSFSNNKNASDNFYNNKTVEYLLHQLNQPYLYFDFNNIDSSSFLNNQIKMNCNQSLSYKARWKNITDGIFYIDNMTNIHKLEK